MKNRKPTKKHTALTKSKDYKEFRDADKIVAYLEDPDGPTPLSKKLRAQLDRYMIVNQLRMKSKNRSFVIGTLKAVHGRTERQANYDITETEYIFGKVIKINAAFEKAYMLEISRKAIELAGLSKDVNKIVKAVLAHKAILGEEVDASLLPDFSKFEAHQYNIVIPPEFVKLLSNVMKGGAVDLGKIIPSQMMDRLQDEIEEAKEVSGE